MKAKKSILGFLFNYKCVFVALYDCFMDKEKLVTALTGWNTKIKSINQSINQLTVLFSCPLYSRYPNKSQKCGSKKQSATKQY